MRTNFIPAALAAVAIHLFANPDVHAQGTIFLSNLGQPSSESLPVGSDSWYAEEFSAGTNSSVYALNAIQVVMGGASGNPNGFMVSLHTNATGGFGSVPGGSVGQLIGPSAPEANGVYTYTAVSPIMIERNVSYYIVVTAGTPVTTGAYPWSTASVFSYASPDGWLAGPTRR